MRWLPVSTWCPFPWTFFEWDLQFAFTDPTKDSWEASQRQACYFDLLRVGGQAREYWPSSVLFGLPFGLSGCSNVQDSNIGTGSEKPYLLLGSTCIMFSWLLETCQHSLKFLLCRDGNQPVCTRWWGLHGANSSPFMPLPLWENGSEDKFPYWKNN